jgi:ABC-type multidrug transport system ATPase subunit
MIEFRNLSFGYKAGQPILNSLSFSIPIGKIIGLVGPNGAGKSTVFKILCGIVRPPENSVFYNGTDIAKSIDHFKEESASMIESPSIYLDLTVWENFNYFKRLLNSTEADCEKLLQEFLLTGHRHVKVHQLSSGLKQRLGLALTLLKKPAILFLDEPVNAIDPFGIRFFRERLIALNQEQGITIVISGHILSEIEKLCNHIIIIDKGSVKSSFENTGETDSLEDLYFKVIQHDHIQTVL